MEVKDILVSAFSHVKVKDNPKHLPLMEILESIRKGTPEVKRRIERIRKEKDKQNRNELKMKLLNQNLLNRQKGFQRNIHLYIYEYYFRYLFENLQKE